MRLTSFFVRNNRLQLGTDTRTFAIRFNGGAATRDSLINHSPAF